MSDASCIDAAPSAAIPAARILRWLSQRSLTVFVQRGMDRTRARNMRHHGMRLLLQPIILLHGRADRPPRRPHGVAQRALEPAAASSRLYVGQKTTVASL